LKISPEQQHDNLVHIISSLLSRVQDPDPACHFDADPDPAFHFDADPDPACQFDADPCPDPACHFDADPDLDPTFQFNADQDISFQKRSKTLEKCSNWLIFHTGSFWLVICKLMRIWIRIQPSL
jgi:hypothetical protein